MLYSNGERMEDLNSPSDHQQLEVLHFLGAVVSAMILSGGVAGGAPELM